VDRAIQQSPSVQRVRLLNAEGIDAESFAFEVIVSQPRLAVLLITALTVKSMSGVNVHECFSRD
jgi:hypothetical protein